MKVSELIELLQALPVDSEVILQSDSEGNGYSPLSGVDGNAIYREEFSWAGDVFSTDWSAEEAGFDEDDWEDFKASNPRCCVLFPVN